MTGEGSQPGGVHPLDDQPAQPGGGVGLLEQLTHADPDAEGRLQLAPHRDQEQGVGA